MVSELGEKAGMNAQATLPTSDAVVAIRELGFPWTTADPFLVCIHHVDSYPRGDERMAPGVPLTGRQPGNDSAQDRGALPMSGNAQTRSVDDRIIAKVLIRAPLHPGSTIQPRS